MTNFKMLREMNIDEMADFITVVCLEGYLDGQRDSLYGTMYDKDWLESEATDND